MPRTSLSERHEALGACIREARQARGMTLEQVADQAELSANFVGELERGKVNVSLARLLRVAEAVDVPLGFLAERFERPGHLGSGARP